MGDLAKRVHLHVERAKVALLNRQDRRQWHHGPVSKLLLRHVGLHLGAEIFQSLRKCLFHIALDAFEFLTDSIRAGHLLSP